ncbi:MAG: hypothetical protein IT355_16405 [Gemmatimonadaceae bacterium]|nr:hypothetical protein [Gemmatimonadaceae bacterium]
MIGAVVLGAWCAAPVVAAAQHGDGTGDSAATGSRRKLQNASDERPRIDYTGLTGDVALARFVTSLDGSMPAPRTGLSLGVGVRTSLRIPHLTLTAAVRVAVSDIAGVGTRPADRAIARVEFLPELGYTVRFRHLRVRPLLGYTPCATWSLTTAEVWPAGGTGARNFRDARPRQALSMGLELPLPGRQSGVQLRFYRLSGRFTKEESRRTVTPVAIRYRGSLLTIGWSGPISEVSLPWR